TEPELTLSSAEAVRSSLFILTRKPILTRANRAQLDVDPRTGQMLSRAHRPLQGTGRDVQNHWQGLGRYATVGLELVLSIVLGFVVGRWIDEKIHAHGWVTLAGFAFGVVAGFRSLYEAAQRMSREARAAAERDRRQRRSLDPS